MKMKNLLPASIILTAFILVGCTKEIPEEDIKSPQPEIKEEVIIQQIADVKMKTCSGVIKGLLFDYPSSWGECGLQPGNEIFFQKDIDEFRVGLVFYVEELNSWTGDMKKSSIVQNDNFGIWKLNGDGCGYSGPCYVVKSSENNWHRISPFVLGSNRTPGRIEQSEDFPDEEINAVISSVKVVEHQSQKEIKTVNGHSSGASSEILKTCDKKILGLTFKFPENWENCDSRDSTHLGQNYGEIHFSKLFNGFKTSLIANIRSIDKEDVLNGHSKEYFEDYAKIAAVEDRNLNIYSMGCGGGFACNSLSINDKYFYEIGWKIRSTQLSPEFLTYKWTPDHDFTPEDMLTILKSVQRIEE